MQNDRGRRDHQDPTDVWIEATELVVVYMKDERVKKFSSSKGSILHRMEGQPTPFDSRVLVMRYRIAEPSDLENIHCIPMSEIREYWWTREPGMDRVDLLKPNTLRKVAG